MLTFLDVLNAFHVSIEVVYTVWHIIGSIFAEKCVQNVIGLKELYSFIFKV